YPGAPSIYYGDEIGMEGGHDPDNRRSLEWSGAQWDRETLDFHRRLLALRRDHAALRRGDYKTVLTHNDNGLFAFLRRFAQARALAVFNRSDRPQEASIPLAEVGEKPLSDWLCRDVEFWPEGRDLRVRLAERGGALLGG